MVVCHFFMEFCIVYINLEPSQVYVIIPKLNIMIGKHNTQCMKHLLPGVKKNTDFFVDSKFSMRISSQTVLGVVL